MAMTEREMVGWIYKQVKARAKGQADLCAAFDAEFDGASESLVEFLDDCKYFRRVGVGDGASWMISANRQDDLREYLAD
jgi:hypothetical protein